MFSLLASAISKFSEYLILPSSTKSKYFSLYTWKAETKCKFEFKVEIDWNNLIRTPINSSFKRKKFSVLTKKIDIAKIVIKFGRRAFNVPAFISFNFDL